MSKAKKSKPKAKKVAVKSTVAREEAHGIVKPRDGGVCRAVWDALDSIRADGTAPTSKEVRALAEKKEWNLNNASIELSRWRRFHGISARA
jgi:hypothetical protein